MRSAAPTCASWSTSSALVGALGWAVISAAIAGCTASADDVHPPRDQLFFPTGLAISPDEHVLFVANANSDQRYDSGSIGVINLDTVDARITDWDERKKRGDGPPDGCEIDPDHRETLVCDEAQFFNGDAGVRIGNFASDLAIQRYNKTETDRVRLFVPTRGDPSISWTDYTGGRLTCTTTSEAFALCDDAHRLVTLQNNPDLPALASEPFSVFADSSNGFAMVTHNLTGTVTLIRSQPGAQGDQVAIVDARDRQFAPNANLVSSASSIAGRIPLKADGTPVGDDIVYVGSTTERRIQTYTVGQRDDAAAFLLPGSYFFLNAVGQSSGSISTQALQFSPGGDRLYLVNRLPPSLQIYDTSAGPTGVPRNALQGASDICQQASKLTLVGQGDRERAYVTCFQDGQIYVVDPRGSSQVEDVISVGRGPYSVAATTGMLMRTPRLFVTNFFEDTLAVIDLADSRTHNRVVLRIGKPRAP